MTLGRCEKLYCFAAQGLECDDGLPLAECTNFHPAGGGQGKRVTVPDQARFFWTGEAFGLRDLTRVAARGRVLPLALLGPSDVGKTSFLTTLYLNLIAGSSLAGGSFAGSFTLGRWEALAAKMRWSGHQEPSFPDHTPRGAARAPGLLHLAIRDGDGRLTDVLLADAPGEWFERWAVNRNDPAAEGARWLETHAGAALLFLDSEKLSDPSTRGGTRTQTLQLLTRVSDTYSDRPWRALWAKHDRFKENPATKVVKEYLARVGHAETLEAVSANATDDARGVMEAFGWLVSQARVGARLTLPSLPAHPDGGLLAFRRGAE